MFGVPGAQNRFNHHPLFTPHWDGLTVHPVHLGCKVDPVPNMSGLSLCNEARPAYTKERGAITLAVESVTPMLANGPVGSYSGSSISEVTGRGNNGSVDGRDCIELSDEKRRPAKIFYSRQPGPERDASARQKSTTEEATIDGIAYRRRSRRRHLLCHRRRYAPRDPVPGISSSQPFRFQQFLLPLKHDVQQIMHPIPVQVSQKAW